MRGIFQRRARRAPILAGLCASVAGAARGVAAARLAGATRGDARVAGARQLAIYLQNVTFCADISTCAALFARDRATIRHALARIEDSRDAPADDFALACLDAALIAQLAMFRDFARAFSSDELEQIDDRN